MYQARERLGTALVVLVSVCLAADGYAANPIRNCADDPACRELPRGSIPLTGISAAKPMLRAASLLLEAEAEEMATWSKASVLVASDLPIRLPAKHRRVPTIALGERALLACGSERYLHVLRPGEAHRSPDGEILVDLAIESFGATCDRADRRVFRHGEDYYRVVLRGRRIEIRWMLKVSD
jgi:hypothetical protein